MTFINGDTSKVIPSIKYQAPVSGYNYTPTQPSGVDASFTFGKWFTTEAAIAGTDFNWSQVMPAKNIVLYANWAPPVFTGVAHSLAYGSTGGTTVDLGTIPYGGTHHSGRACKRANNRRGKQTASFRHIRRVADLKARFADPV